MGKIALLIVTLSMFVAFPVVAEEQVETVSTQYLYTACMDAVYHDDTLYTKTYCKAFIQGAVNAHKLLTSSFNFTRKFCLPGTSTDEKMAGIFIRYAQENPIFFKKPAILTLYYALNNAFPCTESNSEKDPGIVEIK